jgi:hypothetical protein
MQVFHVSETSNIARFEPRATDDGRFVVWAIDETHLPNYVLPRECPRICVRGGAGASAYDIDSLLDEHAHVIYVETAWRESILASCLFVYEFAAENFTCTDANAGYFQSLAPAVPIGMFTINAIEPELRKRGVALRYVESLWPIREAVVQTKLEFSCIRMRNAASRNPGAYEPNKQ